MVFFSYRSFGNWNDIAVKYGNILNLFLLSLPCRIESNLIMDLLLLGSYTRLSCTLNKVKLVDGYINDLLSQLPLPHPLPSYWMKELTNKCQGESLSINLISISLMVRF